MELWVVPVLGAIIGVAINLLSFVWEPVRVIADSFEVRPATLLALGAIGGALITSAQFWTALSLWNLFR
jgi:hypothetical protein